MRALNVGNGFDDSVTIGPLISEKAVEKVEKHTLLTLNSMALKWFTVVLAMSLAAHGSNRLF